eukprot:COSAG01_NODE_63075_length_281_cov_1.131868_2_plen_55_part_01
MSRLLLSRNIEDGNGRAGAELLGRPSPVSVSGGGSVVGAGACVGVVLCLLRRRWN